MIINAHQITQHLNHPLKPVFLVSGDEPYLGLKTCETIRTKAKDLGFIEHRLFIVDAKFTAEELQDSLANLSLFGEQSFIELRLHNKPNTSLKQLLRAYADNPAEDKLLMILMPKLDAAEQKASWVKAIANIGLVIQVWPLNYNELPNWVATRFNHAGFKLDAAAIQFVVEKSENNLLAIDQIIERLKLLNITGQISVEILLNSVADNAHYDIFQFADCVLQGDLQRLNKQLFCLKEQGIEPILILWAIARDLRVFAEAAFEPHRVDAILSEHRVIRRRYPLIKRTFTRRPASFWSECLLKAQQLDSIIKGVKTGEVWLELFALCLQIGSMK
jgi:DNA polymerase-3 subunit delta